MELGNAWLKIDATGSCVPLTGITPAEAAILNADHENNAKGKAVFDVAIVDTVERTGEQEINRLREKYPNARDRKGEPYAEKLYPGKNPVLPQKFSEVGVEVLANKEEPKASAKEVAKAPAATAAPTK